MEHVPLTPGETIPLDVRVIITTEGRKDVVQGRSVITFEEGSDPRRAVEESILLLLGKDRFRELVLGIDPGKQTGLAVLGDGIVLDTGTYTGVKNLIDEVARVLSAFPSERSVVKIGRGAEEYSRILRSTLSSSLSSAVDIQMVEETGTTTDNIHTEEEGISRNIISAIRIALRQGEKAEWDG